MTRLSPITLVIFCCASMTSGQRNRNLVQATATSDSDEHDDSFAEEVALPSSEGGASSGMAAGMKGILGRSYATLPKNEHGRLSIRSTRLLVQEYFAGEHALYLRGLEPHGWNRRRPIPDVLELGLMQEKNASLPFTLDPERGLSFDDVVAYVSLLEKLFVNEAVPFLEYAFRFRNLSTRGKIKMDAGQLTNVLLNTVVMWNGGNADNDTMNYTSHLEAYKKYKQGPEWDRLHEFVSDMTLNHAFARRHTTNPFTKQTLTYEDAWQVLDPIIREFGKWQHADCNMMKDNLLVRGAGGTGRVRLDQFYAQDMSGHRRFVEAPNYLRKIGALDASIPSSPKVLIANYMQGPTNCAANFKQFSTCCIDECVAIMSELQGAAGAPQVEPAALLKILSAISSPTVPAPRRLPKIFTEKVESIASAHGGAVPLHGRLFQQLIHFAFPNECKYPSPNKATESFVASESTERATTAEIERIVKKSKSEAARKAEDKFMSQWKDVEYSPHDMQASSANSSIAEEEEAKVAELDEVEAAGASSPNDTSKESDAVDVIGTRNEFMYVFVLVFGPSLVLFLSPTARARAKAKWNWMLGRPEDDAWMDEDPKMLKQSGKGKTPAAPAKQPKASALQPAPEPAPPHRPKKQQSQAAAAKASAPAPAPVPAPAAPSKEEVQASKQPAPRRPSESVPAITQVPLLNDQAGALEAMVAGKKSKKAASCDVESTSSSADPVDVQEPLVEKHEPETLVEEQKAPVQQKRQEEAEAKVEEKAPVQPKRHEEAEAKVEEKVAVQQKLEEKVEPQVEAKVQEAPAPSLPRAGTNKISSGASNKISSFSMRSPMTPPDEVPPPPPPKARAAATPPPGVEVPPPPPPKPKPATRVQMSSGAGSAEATKTRPSEAAAPRMMAPPGLGLDAVPTSSETSVRAPPGLVLPPPGLGRPPPPAMAPPAQPQTNMAMQGTSFLSEQLRSCAQQEAERSARLAQMASARRCKAEKQGELAEILEQAAKLEREIQELDRMIAQGEPDMNTIFTRLA